jgi:hypothetical protein
LSQSTAPWEALAAKSPRFHHPVRPHGSASFLVQQNHGLFQTQFSAKALSGAGASPYQHACSQPIVFWMLFP